MWTLLFHQPLVWENEQQNLSSTVDKISAVERRKAQRVRQRTNALRRYYEQKEAKMEAAKSVIRRFIMSHCCEVDGSSERGGEYFVIGRWGE